MCQCKLADCCDSESKLQNQTTESVLKRAGSLAFACEMLHELSLSIKSIEFNWFRMEFLFFAILLVVAHMNVD